MLINLLQKISSQFLTKQKRDTVVEATILYILKLLPSQTYKKIAIRNGVGTYIRHLRNNIDTCEYFSQFLWKAIYDWTKGNPPSLVAKKYNVQEDDIWFCIDWLTDSNIDRIEKKAETTSYSAKKMDKKKYLKELEPVAKKLVQRKLRFLLKYDPSLSADDLKNDLLTNSMAVINHYGFEDHNQMLNFTKKAMHKFLINKIKHYQADKRARISGKTKKQIAEEKKTKVQVPFDYTVTTLSLDAPARGNPAMTLYKSTPDTSEDRRRELLDRLMFLPPKQKQLVNQLLELGLNSNYRTESLFKKACCTLNIDPEKMFNKMKETLFA